MQETNNKEILNHLLEEPYLRNLTLFFKVVLKVLFQFSQELLLIDQRSFNKTLFISILIFALRVKLAVSQYKLVSLERIINCFSL